MIHQIEKSNSTKYIYRFVASYFKNCEWCFNTPLTAIKPAFYEKITDYNIGKKSLFSHFHVFT